MRVWATKEERRVRFFRKVSRPPVTRQPPAIFHRLPMRITKLQERRGDANFFATSLSGGGVNN